MESMIESLNNKCKEYGMAINAKKTMVMVIGAKAETKCNITIDGLALEQVKRYKYLGSWITEDVRCDTEVTTRIAMAKTAFWQNKEIMRRNVRHETKLKILNCYVFSVLNYGCESWTWTKALERKINAFEMWCYRRMLKISWMERISNKEVLQRINCNLHFLKQMKKRKMDYAGHVMRGSSGCTHLYILEGKIAGKRPVGRPRATWMSDIIAWTQLKNYAQIKRAAEDRDFWRSMAVDLLLEDDR